MELPVFSWIFVFSHWIFLFAVGFLENVYLALVGWSSKVVNIGYWRGFSFASGIVLLPRWWEGWLCECLVSSGQERQPLYQCLNKEGFVLMGELFYSLQYLPFLSPLYQLWRAGVLYFLCFFPQATMFTPGALPWTHLVFIFKSFLFFF